MYKIETHLHTHHSSSCGWIEAPEIARLYAEAGFAGIVVCDHFSRYNFGKMGWSTAPGAAMDQYLTGYRLLREECGKLGIRVYRGAEVRFDGSPNDYLLYNYPLELLHDPEKVFTGGLEAFSAACRQCGALLIQAHPFRKPCSPADPALLDGTEVCNMHPRQENRNCLSAAMARAHPHLIRLCGSDFHQLPDVGRGGILVDALPEDEAALADLLRSRSFQIPD